MAVAFSMMLMIDKKLWDGGLNSFLLLKGGRHAKKSLENKVLHYIKNTSTSVHPECSLHARKLC